MGRYDFDDGPLAHVSRTCIVVFGTDLDKNGANVALKFMENRDSYEREKSLRQKQKQSFQDAVISIEVTHVRDSDPELYGLGWSRLAREPAQYPYCIVMPRGDRSLQDAVSQQHKTSLWEGCF